MKVITVSIVAGLAVTIITAWVCWLWPRPFTVYRVNIGPQPWVIASAASPHQCVWRSFDESANAVSSVLRTWSPASDIMAGEADGRVEWQHAAGWPMPALATKAECEADPQGGQGAMTPVRTHWAIPAPKSLYEYGLVSQTGGMPIFPMWRGFLVDWFLATACVWLLIRAVRGAIEWRRMRAGLCPGCAHILAGAAACPECGRAAPRRDAVRLAS